MEEHLLYKREDLSSDLRTRIKPDVLVCMSVTIARVRM